MKIKRVYIDPSLKIPNQWRIDGDGVNDIMVMHVVRNLIFITVDEVLVEYCFPFNRL